MLAYNIWQGMLSLIFTYALCQTSTGIPFYVNIPSAIVSTMMLSQSCDRLGNPLISSAY